MMMKLALCVVFSLLLMVVTSRPTARSFEPETKTATIVEVEELKDPHFIFPPVPDLPDDADTYFVFYEYHDEQLVKNTLLQCSDNKPGGTHPYPVEGCEEILEVEGDCDQVESVVPAKLCLCPTDFDPVIVNVQGKFKGADFSFLKTFSNPCEFQCVTEPLQHFFNVGLGFKDHHHHHGLIE